MSDSSASFQYDPNSAPPWAAPATFEELLFAFEAYQEINNRCRFSYLLHLLQLDLPSIALAEKITPDDAADRIAEAEKTLTEHVEACAKEYFLFQDDPGYKRSHLTPNAEEMLRRIFRLIEPDDLDAYAKLVKSGVKTQKNKRTDTVRLILRERVFHLTLQLLAIRENVQKPLDSLFPVLERVWRIYGMYAAEQKKTRNESVKYLPQPTRSELIEAKKVLFAMPKRLRTTFGLCDCAGLGIAEIVRELRVPPEKVEAWITQSHEFLARYTENLILEMLRHRELGIKTQLPLSALRTATFIWNTLPENFRNAYLRIVSDEHDTTLQENPELLEEIHHFITIQMGMMIMVLIRLASHGSPPPHYVRHLTRKRKNLKIKRPPSRMPISDTLGFALEIMNREHRETLQHSYGLKKIVSEIADMQHVPEEIVMERFDEARDIYDARVDYILCKMLIHDGDGKGPRLRQNEKRFAKRIFAEVPYNCREVTEEFLTTRASEEEIAEELDMPLHAVQDQLHRGLEVVRQNSLELLRDYLENEAKNQNEIDTIRHPRAEPALDWIGGGEPDEDDDDFDNKYTQEELSIAAKTITSFDLNEQAVAAVFYGQLLEPKQIGPALGIPMNEAYPLYDTIRKKLHERTLRLADAIILGDESVQGHEKNAVQNVLNTMDEFNRDVYERKARGATFEQIGKTFGIPAIEAEVRYESAQFVINSWTEMLASTWLRQKVDGTTNTDRILHKYRENRAETRRTDPDQAAAKEAFAALDATSQELFIRYFLHDTEDDADEKVEEICDFLKRHLVSHILKDDETGRRTLLDLPETAGKMFRRVEIQSESIADVAESMNVAPETVQAGLESAEYIINLRMKTLVLQWLTTEENGESNADRISRELHEKATVKSASTKLAVDHVQEPAALETASPKKWSFAASLFGGVGCSNAAPVIPFTTWLPMICVVPFLWFISLYITGAASGTVVIF